jgi:hypothetical protein
MKPKDLTSRLKADIPDEKLDELCTFLVKNVNRSRGVMAAHYESWDKALDTYRSVRTPDAHDIRARSKREPEKMTVPLSYAQVNTLVTFLFLAYTQKESIFELVPTGPEDYGKALTACQAIIDREVRNTNYHSKLVQALLDMARFNIGVMKTSWRFETKEVKRKTPAIELPFDLMTGLALPMAEPTEMEDEVIVFDGNEVEVISPYYFFYDTRQPLSSWKRGRFAADETQFHFQELRAMEKNGEMFGIEHITPFDAKQWKLRQSGTRLKDIDPQMQRKGAKSDDYMVCILTVQAKITPKDYELSDEDEEQIWVFGIANDQRIVSARPLNAPHNEFTYDVLTMSPDQHTELSDSLSMLIDPLQEVVTWLLNARVAAVRQNVEGRYVIDPSFVEVADLTAGHKYIRLKKNAPYNQGVSAFIQQLKTVDPTVTHMQDAETLMRMMQIVSGVNENSMGQVASGRRSATENRAANAGAASRMKLIAATVWVDGLASQGRKMLLNTRQDLMFETFERVVGDNAQDYWSYFHAEDPTELLGNEDYFSYDGTLSSEKNYIAQSLQELVGILASNPEVLAATNLDLVEIIKEIQELRGIKNLNRFEKPPQPNGLPGTTPALPPGTQPAAPLPGTAQTE